MNGNPLLLWIVLGVALVLLLFPKLLRALTLTLLGRRGREAVGRRTISKQPDTITLDPSSRVPSPPAQAILDGLRTAGFDDAGGFVVRELALLPVHFMVKPSDTVTAAVYEHRVAGVWYDLYTHFEDGTSLTYSTARLGGGLDPRPGHPVVRLPGLAPTALLARFLAARPAGAMKPVSAAAAPDAFVRAYAESAAWRKQHGVSADEVDRVGMGSARR